MTDDPFIYKIMSQLEWANAEANGVYTGAPIDVQDGFIHFSTAEQAGETAAKHFTGRDDLLLVAVRVADLSEALRWEVSRGDALFPHLYADLPLKAVEWSKPMPLVNGVHILPLPPHCA